MRYNRLCIFGSVKRQLWVRTTAPFTTLAGGEDPPERAAGLLRPADGSLLIAGWNGLTRIPRVQPDTAPTAR